MSKIKLLRDLVSGEVLFFLVIGENIFLLYSQMEERAEELLGSFYKGTNLTYENYILMM